MRNYRGQREAAWKVHVVERVDSETREPRLDLLVGDLGFLDTWTASPEFTFLLVVAGITCTAAGLAGHAIAWSIPGGALLLTGAGLLLARTGVSGGSAALLVVALLCVFLEVFELTGFGIHAAAAATSLLLAGLAITGPPEIHPALAVPTSVGLGMGVFIAAFTSWRRRRERPFDTTPRLTGRGAVVMTDSTSAPVAVVAGEIWQLEATHSKLEDGQFVRVVHALDGKLLVRPAPPPRP